MRLYLYQTSFLDLSLIKEGYFAVYSQSEDWTSGRYLPFEMLLG